MAVSRRTRAPGLPLKLPRNKNPMLRLVWFDQQLRAQKYPTAQQFADHFEMTPRTAYRDVEYFKEQLRLPITYDPQQGGYCYSEANAPLNPLFTVTQGELLALYVSQRVLEQYEGTQYAAMLAGALQKISAHLTETVTIDFDSIREGFSFHIGPPGRLEVEIFARASEAVRAEKPLAMAYHTQSRNDLTRRVVDPYHLHNHAGVWYLIGFDHKSRSYRTFNLSRVRKAQVQEQPFERRKDFDLKAYLRDGFEMMRGEQVERVSIRFDAEQARYIQERTWHPSERRDRHPDGSLTLRFELSGLEGVKRWVLSYGAHAEVLEPEGLRRAVAAEARRLAGLYRAT